MILILSCNTLLLFRAKIAFKGIFKRSEPFCPSENLDKDTKKYDTKKHERLKNALF